MFNFVVEFSVLFFYATYSLCFLTRRVTLFPPCFSPSAAKRALFSFCFVCYLREIKPAAVVVSIYSEENS